MTNTETRQAEFDRLWQTYIAKLVRVDSLKDQGRCGYQLRMPKKSVQTAYNALVAFCHAHGLSDQF